jgi:hypothetical protein
MDGLVLLVFICAIAAFGWTRLRGKMKLGVSGKHWVAPIIVIGIILLVMYATHVSH